MPECKKCGGYFPYKIVVGGKKRSLTRRKFCLDCSPFGQHNTSNRPGRSDDETIKERRAKIVQNVTAWRKRRKLELIEYKGGRCQRCGYNKPVPGAYEFHHKDPNVKDFQISGSTVAIEKMKAEVDKCDLLCACCHAEVHDEIERIKAVNQEVVGSSPTVGVECFYYLELTKNY
jgi:hypothetical protein